MSTITNYELWQKTSDKGWVMLSSDAGRLTDNKARTASRDLGLKTYESVSPCRRGHWGPRYTTNGACVACREMPRPRANKKPRSPASPETREKMRQAKLGKPIRAEVREKISATKKAKKKRK